MTEKISDFEKDFRASLPANVFKGAGKFEAKLTFAQRCSILALDQMDFKRHSIAAAYNVARPTVAYICNPASRYYKDVRREYADLGREAFMKKYLNDDAKFRIENVSKMEAAATDANYKELRRLEAEEAVKVRGPDRSAKSQEGTHRMWMETDQVTWSFSIAWEETFGGWGVRYSEQTAALLGAKPGEDTLYRDPTRDNPTYETSQKAKDAFVENWNGELV